MGSTNRDRDDEPRDALDLEQALTSKQAATLLGVADITLTQWRARGEGPAFFRVGKRHIRYVRRHVLAYRDERTCGRKVQP